MNMQFQYNNKPTKKFVDKNIFFVIHRIIIDLEKMRHFYEEKQKIDFMTNDFTCAAEQRPNTAPIS